MRKTPPVTVRKNTGKPPVKKAPPLTVDDKAFRASFRENEAIYRLLADR
jgi:hypothetical protein